MKRIVVTNNRKVKDKFSGKAEIQMIEAGNGHHVFKAAKEIAQKGGKLLIDPTRGDLSSFYKSIVFVVEEGGQPDKKSMEIIERCVEASTKIQNQMKEPLLAGILQNKEVDLLKKVLC